MARPADIEFTREWTQRQTKHGDRMAKVGETLDETASAWRSLLALKPIDEASAAVGWEAWQAACATAIGQRRQPPTLKGFLDENPVFQKDTIDAFAAPGWLGAEDPHACRQIYEEFNRFMREQTRRAAQVAEDLPLPDRGSTALRLIAAREPRREEVPDDPPPRVPAWRLSLIAVLEQLGAGRVANPSVGMKARWRSLLTSLRTSLLPVRRMKTITREPEYPVRSADAFFDGAGALGELPDDQLPPFLQPRAGDGGVELPGPVEESLRRWVAMHLEANARGNMRAAWWLGTPMHAFIELRTPPKPSPRGFVEWLLWFFHRKRRLREWERAREAVIFKNPPEKTPANRAMWQVMYDGRDRCREEARAIDEARGRLLSPLRGLHERAASTNRRTADALAIVRVPRLRTAEEAIDAAQAASHEALGARGEWRALLRRVDERLEQKEIPS